MADMRKMWLAPVVVLVVAGCAGDGEAGPTRAELTDALVDGGFEPAEARCWIGEAFEHLSVEDKRAIERVDTGYEDFANPEEIRSAGDACL